MQKMQEANKAALRGNLSARVLQPNAKRQQFTLKIQNRNKTWLDFDDNPQFLGSPIQSPTVRQHALLEQIEESYRALKGGFSESGSSKRSKESVTLNGYDSDYVHE